jgi:hypothetical protein
MYLIRLIRGFFVKRPNRELTWTVKDFNWAKNWAKTQPHPKLKNKTLWDYLNQPWKDSVDILHEVNMGLKLKDDGVSK